ncbi:MAG: LppA family lipoprotein [Desulfomonile sp.]|nr:LppA family lipoprotein [Desulfomonile sp.]
MRQFLKLLVGMALVPAIVSTGPGPSCDEWPGVDEAVVKKFAEKAGRPAREPFFDPPGDVLLFAFLLAGAGGGFVAGYQFRALFPPQAERARESSHV